MDRASSASACTSRSSASRALLVGALWLALAGAATAQSPAGGRVQISGGRDASGQNYAWTIRNDGDAAIRFVEFPHFRADLWNAPEGWQTEAVNLQGAPGTKGESGVLRAWTDDPRLMIQPGRSAEFSLRVNRQEAYRGTGSVLLRFADGGELRVAGVDVPCPPTFLDQYGMPLGLAAILLVYVASRVSRRKRPAAAPVASEPDPNAS